MLNLSLLSEILNLPRQDSIVVLMVAGAVAMAAAFTLFEMRDAMTAARRWSDVSGRGYRRPARRRSPSRNISTPTLVVAAVRQAAAIVDPTI